MLKALLAGTAALAIAGSSLVYAQQPRGPERPAARCRPRAAMATLPEDAAAFAEARIRRAQSRDAADARTGRELAAFEAAVRDFAKQRRERLEARTQRTAAASPVERLRRGADALTRAAPI